MTKIENTSKLYTFNNYTFISSDYYKKVLQFLGFPCLIVSTKVGRGNISIAEAIKEIFSEETLIYHIPIEDMLPSKAVNEDLFRYRYISNNFPYLLNLVYRIPFFYYRKLKREESKYCTDLSKIKSVILNLGIKTVICISHRPTFWLSALKKRESMDFKLIGVLTEFGRNLGWKYIFWDVVDMYLSPIEKELLDYPFHEKLEYIKTGLITRNSIHELSKQKGNKNKVLFIAGFWGQIFYKKAIKILSEIYVNIPEIQILVVCGNNKELFEKLLSHFAKTPNIKVMGEVDYMERIYKDCASVITKPGFSTIVETYTAGRKIFLIKGMPVAEDHNAEYAIKYLNAEWFDLKNFKKWYYNSNHEQ